MLARVAVLLISVLLLAECWSWLEGVWACYVRPAAPLSSGGTN